MALWDENGPLEKATLLLGSLVILTRAAYTNRVAICGHWLWWYTPPWLCVVTMAMCDRGFKPMENIPVCLAGVTGCLAQSLDATAASTLIH